MRGGLYFRKLWQGLELLESRILKARVLQFCLPDLRLATKDLELGCFPYRYKENANDLGITLASACVLLANGRCCSHSFCTDEDCSFFKVRTTFHCLCDYGESVTVK